MTSERFKLRLSKLGNGMITDTQKRKDLYFDKEFLDATLPKANEWLNKLDEENEQLKSEIQQYRVLLQDMGLLMSDNEANDIRNDIADKFLKPLFKMNGFDVDINTDDGFIIIPKGDD